MMLRNTGILEASVSRKAYDQVRHILQIAALLRKLLLAEPLNVKTAV